MLQKLNADHAPTGYEEFLTALEEQYGRAYANLVRLHTTTEAFIYILNRRLANSSPANEITLLCSQYATVALSTYSQDTGHTPQLLKRSHTHALELLELIDKDRTEQATQTH